MDLLEDEREPSRPEKSCKYCKYFHPYLYEFDDTDVDSDYGECRRFPPKLTMPEEQQFPVVQINCWCGEFDF